MDVRRTVSVISFGVRLGVFLFLPTVYDSNFSQQSIALIFGSVLIGTLAVDFMVGNTTWVSSKPITLMMYAVYLALLWLVMQTQSVPQLPFILLSLLLLLVLSSDAIANSRRWKVLLYFMAIHWVIALALRPTLSPPPSNFELRFMPYYFLVYSLIPSVAALTRLFFPRTKHLIHTSLDYPPIRLEILSMGMKRVAAIGIRSNSGSGI